jgi:CarD family transcriptional regulator
MARIEAKGDSMTFGIGDVVVHPLRGAGVVEQIQERQWHGRNAVYYRIALLCQPGTSVMIPASAAAEVGLRRVVSQATLKKVWHVLCDVPRKLPPDHKDRYKVLEEKLHTGNVFKVAEAVRDMAWRQKQRGRLTLKGTRIYEKAIMLLAGEAAAVDGIDLIEAEARVRTTLRENLSVVTVM